VHLKPTAGCQISTLIFENKLWRVGPLLKSHKKYIKDGKVLDGIFIEVPSPHFFSNIKVDI
jgi:hypothetical protein